MDSLLVSRTAETPDTPTLPNPASHGATQGRPSGRGFFLGLIGIVLFGAVVWQFGIKPRITIKAELRRDAAAAETRAVIVQHPILQSAEYELLLPATVQAFRQTTLYAQTAGYLKSWLVDMGDSVKAGQLLAEIDSPDVDQQLAQAKAALDQAVANLELAQAAAKRWKELFKTHASTAQQGDETLSAEKARTADFSAAKAKVAQYTELQRFKQIIAPFDGTITSRSIEIGGLISVGANPTELFRIAQTDQMRVRVNVPQTSMRSITPNLSADLVVREYRNRHFPGSVTRTSKAIDPQSRTLLSEVTTPNPDGALLPGMYAQIRFKLKNPEPTLLVPSSALVIRGSGTMVSVVDSLNRYAYRKVQLGRDLGAQVEITEGIRPEDRVVTNPSDDLSEGMVVNVQAAEKVNKP